ncbi:MAG: hypothetical protein KF805_08605 [Phycisphaeraceae bacterium]|nr:hypothetical protein [Phycisphaeraceae bacterium]
MATNAFPVAIISACCFNVSAQTLSVPPDSDRWDLEGKAEVSEFQGRKCLRIEGGGAVLKDFEMKDAVIDVDIATTAKRGFAGIQFRIDPSNGSGEWVYVRPHKSGLPDAQQYTPFLNGGAAWQIYSGPGFIGPVEIPSGQWFHFRLEVTGAQARMFVGDMKQPSLVIDDLKSGNRAGLLALSVLTGTTYFSNFELRETPQNAWERHEPPMPPKMLTKWRLSPAMDALDRNLEKPLKASELDAIPWDMVDAEAPGFVVINRYRASPGVNATFGKDWSRRLDPQPGTKVVYARTTINSERDEVRQLSLGYSDEVRVFLNGEILFRGRSAQYFRDPGFLGIVSVENDSVFLKLKKGQNELVLAVSELGGGWGFVCRLEDERD